MSATRNDLRSQALDLLRFPLACIIVISHVFNLAAITVQGVTYSFVDHSITEALTLFVRTFLAKQSVPVYFFISGYVFFLGINLDMPTYARKMRNRFKSLFIPYMAWNFLGILLFLLPYTPMFSGFFPGLAGKSPDFHLANILNMFWDVSHGMSPLPNGGHQDGLTYPVDGALWFVRDLMIVAVTTPLINILLKRLGKLLPITLGIAWFCLPDAGLGHGYQLLTACFFFSLGAYLSFNRRDMITEFKRMRIPAFIVYPAVAAALMACCYYGNCEQQVMQTNFTGWLQYVKNIAVLAGLPFAYNLAVLIIERWKIRPSASLAGASFFLYAGHLLILHYVQNLLAVAIRPASDFASLSVQILTAVILIFGLLGVYFAMRRYTPHLLALLTGGRF